LAFLVNTSLVERLHDHFGLDEDRSRQWGGYRVDQDCRHQDAICDCEFQGSFPFHVQRQILFGTDLSHIEGFDSSEEYAWMSRDGMSNLFALASRWASRGKLLCSLGIISI
jgi:hypothetical protein